MLINNANYGNSDGIDDEDDDQSPTAPYKSTIPKNIKLSM